MKKPENMEDKLVDAIKKFRTIYNINGMANECATGDDVEKGVAELPDFKDIIELGGREDLLALSLIEAVDKAAAGFADAYVRVQNPTRPDDREHMDTVIFSISGKDQKIFRPVLEAMAQKGYPKALLSMAKILGGEGKNWKAKAYALKAAGAYAKADDRRNYSLALCTAMAYNLALNLKKRGIYPDTGRDQRD